jgi:hypothetical protein
MSSASGVVGPLARRERSVYDISLTVAEMDIGGRFDEISAELATHMPILARAEFVNLMAGRQQPGSWRTLEALALG